MIRRPPKSPLFPYPPLFRSRHLRPLRRRRALRHEPAAGDLPRRHPLPVPPVPPPGQRPPLDPQLDGEQGQQDRKSTRLNSSHLGISYAVFCLKKKKKQNKI